MLITREIPWLRILAEGVAIAVSILLAFGIEAWWSNRQVQQNVQDNLIALREELHDNIREIEHELTYRQAVIASMEKDFISVNSANDLSPNEHERDRPLLGEISEFLIPERAEPVGHPSRLRACGLAAARDCGLEDPTRVSLQPMKCRASVASTRPCRHLTDSSGNVGARRSGSSATKWSAR